MAKLDNNNKSTGERFEIRKVANGYILTETDETGETRNVTDVQETLAFAEEFKAIFIKIRGNDRRNEPDGFKEYASLSHRPE